MMEQELLEVALEAAHRAGGILLQRSTGSRQVTVKGFRDTVTDADMAAEAAILAVIRERFPDHAVLSEEAGASGPDSPFVWLVDPLDGTTNYSRGYPIFCVSVAVVHQGEPIVGVVHDPLRQHTFAAVRGGGARAGSGRAVPSQISGLEDALVGVDWARARDEREEMLRRLVVLAPRCRTVRAIGSAALALTYVGLGWLDAYFAAGLCPWDVAAASLFVSEAGGRLTDLAGQPWRLGGRALLATNGLLHDAVLDLWAGALSVA